MDALNKVNRSIINKVKIKDSQNDFDFWQNQPYEVRLAALENIRQEYIRWKYGSDPGFQRVCTIYEKYFLVKSMKFKNIDDLIDEVL